MAMLAQLRTGTLMLGALASMSAMTPLAAPAVAQGWNNGSCRGLDGRDRARCERASDRRDDRRENRWDRERDRRKDAKTDGIVAGVIGTAILGGIIAAAASKKNKNNDGRRDYCEERYGNYDDRDDTYRASDGRRYPCT